MLFLFGEFGFVGRVVGMIMRIDLFKVDKVVEVDFIILREMDYDNS